MTDILSELALDALGEISNIGAGNAASALSQLLGVTVDLGVPSASLVPLARASEQVGPAEREVVAVLTGVHGAIGACVLLVFSNAAASSLCETLGVDAQTEMGMSALQEIGNILTSSYVTAIGTLTGMTLEPSPPAGARDMLGALVDGVLALASSSGDAVLLVQTAMWLEGVEAEFAFLFVPERGGVQSMLGALGVAA
jgi:chemotaxis protein CheC